MNRADFPALEGRPVTEAHARLCREQGHASHAVDGTPIGRCPRCGEIAPSANHPTVDLPAHLEGPRLPTTYRPSSVFGDDFPCCAPVAGHVVADDGFGKLTHAHPFTGEPWTEESARDWRRRCEGSGRSGGRAIRIERCTCEAGR